MTPAKLSVAFSFYPYGGNGSSPREAPAIRNWFAKTLLKAKADDRIGETHIFDLNDTPVTMVRNRAVLLARQAGADILVMVDSDQHPDLYEGQPGARPFWDSSLDFLYERKTKGLVTVIAAPYCGPPPNECVYVFKWTSDESEAQAHMRLEMYSRDEASLFNGIHPAAALPTGLIMFDMEIFNITDPSHEYHALLERYGDRRIAQALTKPWFYYEWEDFYAANKASTEDVTTSRDMALLCTQKLGYSPIFCNWDAWAGHYKPKCVGKPQLVTTDMVNDKYQQAVLRGRQSNERMIDVGSMNRRWAEVNVNGTRVAVKE